MKTQMNMFKRRWLRYFRFWIIKLWNEDGDEILENENSDVFKDED
jgi:hypothetical protein